MNYAYPDEKGHYGIYGGRYVPETLMQSVLELEEAYKEAMQDEAFQKELDYYLETIYWKGNTALFCRKYDEVLRRCKNLFEA